MRFIPGLLKVYPHSQLRQPSAPVACPHVSHTPPLMFATLVPFAGCPVRAMIWNPDVERRWRKQERSNAFPAK